MPRPIVAGNWKMFKTPTEAVALVDAMAKGLQGIQDVDVVVVPPFVALAHVAARIKDSPIALGAQNMHWESSGAYTGEISAPMLKELGCQYVIIGHSERRQHFSETDSMVNRKVKAALAHQLTPILCIGETLQERQANRTMERISEQLAGALDGLSTAEIERLVLAYEPVWAIGTGQTATDGQAQEVHAFIRSHLASHASDRTSRAVRIQYGGSVKPDNAAGLLAQPDIDGCLVGGASLSAESFIAIVRAAT